jgi:hypothetical protein
MKEFAMHISKPNRTQVQDSDRNETQQKQSGDQHILPVDEPAADPHRPHRVNHQDHALRTSDDSAASGMPDSGSAGISDNDVTTGKSSTTRADGSDRKER